MPDFTQGMDDEVMRRIMGRAAKAPPPSAKPAAPTGPRPAPFPGAVRHAEPPATPPAPVPAPPPPAELAGQGLLSQGRPQRLHASGDPPPPDVKPFQQQSNVIRPEDIPDFMKEQAEAAERRGPPQVVGIDSLPPEKQAEFRRLAAEVMGNELPPLPPPVTPPAANVAPEPVSGFSPEQEKPDSPPAASGSELQRCPRCAVNLNVPYEGEQPTDNDRLVFISTLRTGSFVKTYKMFGGQMEVTFRVPNSNEQFAAGRAQIENVDEKKTTPEDYNWRSLQYGLVTTLDEVRFPDGFHYKAPFGISKVVSGPQHPSYYDPDEPDPSRAMETARVKLINEIFLNDTLVRAVLVEMLKFARLMDRMRWELADPKISWGLPVSVQRFAPIASV